MYIIKTRTNSLNLKYSPWHGDLQGQSSKPETITHINHERESNQKTADLGAYMTHHYTVAVDNDKYQTNY